MTDVFRFYQGSAPLLISVPHDGRKLPDQQRERMTPAAIALPDTDWHVAELYAFARELGASMLVADYSRYVVDLNRPATDEALYAGQIATGLCPTQTFAGAAIYASGDVDKEETTGRVANYWKPYHNKLEQELARTVAQYGYALLWDAHSIATVVPRLFDGALPALNIGTNSGASCAPAIERAVTAAATASPFETVLNERFKGGFITRNYGDPNNHVHALQLEIAQRAYMDEQTGIFDVQLANALRETLRELIAAMLQAAADEYVILGLD